MLLSFLSRVVQWNTYNLSEMKKSSINWPSTPLILVLLVVAIANVALATENDIPQRFDDAQLWRIPKVPANSEKQLSLGAVLEDKFAATIWKDNSDDLDVSIEKKNLAAAKAFLKESNLEPEVLNSNIQILFDQEKPKASKRSRSVGRSIRGRSSGMNWQDYQPLATIYAFLRELVTQYPNICSLINIGKTANGRDLLVLRISENPTGYKKIWIDGGIHAREWVSPATVTYTMQKLLSNWNQQPAYIKQKTWFFMPVVNPDGYEYSRSTNRLWRKNRAVNKGSTCVGVDLNRNFNIGWTAAGSSTNPCSDVYRGASAASELETKAVSNFLTQQKANLAAYLTYHSYSQAIVYPWAYKAANAPNSNQMQSVANLAAQRIKSKTGMTYDVSVTYKMFGIAGGGSDDWSKSALNPPIVFTVELRDTGDYGFVLPPEQIVGTGEEGYILATTVAEST